MTVAGTADQYALLLRLTPAALDADGTHGVVTGFASIYTEIHAPVLRSVVPISDASSFS